MQYGFGIVCPYCEAECREPDEAAKDLSDRIILCPKCNRRFTLKMAMRVEYTTEGNCELNNVEHDWQASATSRWLWCRNCDEEKEVIT